MPVCLYCDTEHPAGALYCTYCDRPLQYETPYPVLQEALTLMDCPLCNHPGLIFGQPECPNCMGDLTPHWRALREAQQKEDARETDPFGQGPARPEPARATCPKCPHCGAEHRPAAKFCPKTGKPLAGAPAALAFELVVLRPDGGERCCIKLKEGDNQVGAPSPGEGILPDVDLSVGEEPGEPTVSRRHAVLRVENGRVTVTDCGSTNGTRVNRRPLAKDAPAAVGEGDQIAFANVVCRLRRL